MANYLKQKHLGWLVIACILFSQVFSFGGQAWAIGDGDDTEDITSATDEMFLDPSYNGEMPQAPDLTFSAPDPEPGGSPDPGLEMLDPHFATPDIYDAPLDSLAILTSLPPEINLPPAGFPEPQNSVSPLAVPDNAPDNGYDGKGWNFYSANIEPPKAEPSFWRKSWNVIYHPYDNIILPGLYKLRDLGDYIYDGRDDKGGKGGLRYLWEGDKDIPGGGLKQILQQGGLFAYDIAKAPFVSAYDNLLTPLGLNKPVDAGGAFLKYCWQGSEGAGGIKAGAAYVGKAIWNTVTEDIGWPQISTFSKNIALPVLEWAVKMRPGEKVDFLAGGLLGQLPFRKSLPGIAWTEALEPTLYTLDYLTGGWVPNKILPEGKGASPQDSFPAELYAKMIKPVLPGSSPTPWKTRAYDSLDYLLCGILPNDSPGPWYEFYKGTWVDSLYKAANMPDTKTVLGAWLKTGVYPIPSTTTVDAAAQAGKSAAKFLAFNLINGTATAKNTLMARFRQQEAPSSPEATIYAYQTTTMNVDADEIP